MSLIRRTSHTLLACVLLGAALTPVPAAVAASIDRTAPAIAAIDESAVAQVKQELDAAEATAAEASRRALEASAVAESTRLQAETTATRARELTAQSVSADAAETSATAAAGVSAARLYRTVGGGPLVAQLLTDADPDSFLERLGILDRVSTVAARTAGRARSTADVATSLRAQSEQARDEAARLAADAQTTAAAAQSDADAEAAIVSTAQSRLDELYAQLAALRATTAAQERAAREQEKVRDDAALPGGATGGPTAGGSTGSGGGSSSGGTSSGGTSSGGTGANNGGGSGSGGGGTGSSGSGGGSSSGGNTTAPAGPIMSPSEARATARGAIGRYGWGDDQFSCLVSLWNRESGWRVDAYNAGSGAYGIPQALPGDKMASAGLDWRTSAATQISWGLSYIGSRYGSPCGAWDHSQRTGWY